MIFPIKAGRMVRLFILALALVGHSQAQSPSQGEILTFQEPHMGTLFTIKVWVNNQEDADQCRQLARKGFDRIAELNAIFSDYLVESELSLLAKAPPNEAVPVSDELLDVLVRSGQLFKASDGAFDVTIGPMVRLWRRSRKAQKLPTQIQIEAAKTRTGFEKIVIDQSAKTVTKLVDHMVFDLGGIAKGYAANEVLVLLREAGYPRALIAASGDVALGESPPGKKWSVGLETLEMAKAGEAGFEIEKAAVSTSGDTQRFLIIDGTRYSHIVDKQTGLGLTERIAVTVIAADATTSDSYATAVSILGKEKGLKLIEATKGLECRIVTVDGNGKSKIYLSSGYPAKPN